eukprot:CAMPEP_0113539740 /NCGR_PEP_ID=MMETSP0015_2-20120614/8093_1 /TAXON_ID=2838 /ORGANISM="Odontella" /LENGTH=74 /DNA_ID=CAMNT_0000439467 /DNA_START=364 /DNA_END=585 /DNA_ORIENTATION=- /assembly_acc=CAM_ASM_000160
MGDLESGRGEGEGEGERVPAPERQRRARMMPRTADADDVESSRRRVRDLASRPKADDPIEDTVDSERVRRALSD